MLEQTSTEHADCALSSLCVYLLHNPMITVIEYSMMVQAETRGRNDPKHTDFGQDETQAKTTLPWTCYRAQVLHFRVAHFSESVRSIRKVGC